MTSQLQPLATRPDNLTSMVFEAIRDSIVNATIPPGSRISEASVAAQLDVSKTPVREALLRLRHIGLVEPTQRGLQVIRPSVKAIRDAYEYRAGIESVSARYAANRASAEEIERIFGLAEQSLARAEDADPAGFRRLDREFHTAVSTATRNDILQRSIEDALVLTSALRERDVAPSGDSISCAHEHVGVAQAIQAGNADAAADAMSAHVLHVMSLVLSSRPAANKGVSSSGLAPRGDLQPM
ncbi:GntR family transcriptional regulator [Antrihabitans sp. YC2-6]|uniref:GntR family transcriptional regulator n=1 Tax=Antrihabitans sp. YC2-6 TaxID=2799498 RepID=UPI0018F3755A|nr:GntR family transcriptional regulator [Antrihabitans sp. YC2-6]MBJ8344328.1 GntR family transcriptional regulator [Antrihabitans sp. YC2-6]